MQIRQLLGLVSGLLLLVSGAAQDALTVADRDAIRHVIEAQIGAFRKDDAALAFSYAAPAIQQKFVNPDTFMRMVKTAYQAVYRPGSVVFAELVFEQGIPVQNVFILDGEGRSVLAHYPMEKQADGSWRIAGCYLEASSDKLL